MTANGLAESDEDVKIDGRLCSTALTLPTVEDHLLALVPMR